MVVFHIENRTQRSLLSVCVIFMVLPIVAVTLRLYGRRQKGVRLDMSDYMILCALLLSVGFCCVEIACVFKGGLGMHTEDILRDYGPSPSSYFTGSALLTGLILWALAISFVRLSLLTFYCRVFPFRYFILLVKGMATFILLWTFGGVPEPVPPLQAYRVLVGPDNQGRECSNTKTAYLVTGPLKLVSDVVIVIMPMPYLLKLEMKPVQKLPLMATFGLGIFVCVTTIMRMNGMTVFNEADVTYSFGDTVIRSIIEPALAITLACVPFWKPVFPYTRSTIPDYYSSSRTLAVYPPQSNATKRSQGPHGNNEEDPYPLRTLVSVGEMDEMLRDVDSPPGSIGGVSDQQNLVPASPRGGGLWIVVQREFEIT
ncbi:hypothetical protein BJX68DRAFT_263250 [Aspergillus pseudodeflectus]|uniref:Rhodopsin domain-containing protein n=1 Tax=Aspergillus pseudodeflectus TaxID=176178 RepID=A0ABR4KWU6_9EURO